MGGCRSGELCGYYTGVRVGSRTASRGDGNFTRFEILANVTNLTWGRTFGTLTRLPERGGTRSCGIQSTAGILARDGHCYEFGSSRKPIRTRLDIIGAAQAKTPPGGRDISCGWNLLFRGFEAVSNMGS